MQDSRALVARIPGLLVTLLWLAAACSHSGVKSQNNSPRFPQEKRLSDIRQITQGGTNAEAYWSFDGKRLSFQHKGEGIPCDQIFSIRSDGSERVRVSNGEGRTTCSYFLPDNQRIIYSSTFKYGAACPALPDMSKGYVWPVYDTYQIFSAKPDGSDVIPLEPAAPRAYNAEATVCKDGSVVFTSDRNGDLDLYVGKLNSQGTLTDVKQVTKSLGYDGGAFFSADCSRLVWRASRPTGKAAEDYKTLLRSHVVRPSELEIWVADRDGRHSRQVTHLGAASFAPYFTPDAKRIIFASNKNQPGSRKFDLWLINVDGTGLEQVTFSGTFDSFPMFSPDGKSLAFASNRNAAKPGETNVFVADWVESVEGPVASGNARAADRINAIVRALSAPEMDGRGPGTAGLAKSEAYVEEKFRELGLKPFQGSYRQEFEAKSTGPAPWKLANIIGTWGDRCGKTAPVIVGAHMDHLGYGSEISMNRDKKGLHPGADDNASGVASVIEAARTLTADPMLKKQSCFYWVAFSGEELGTLGSAHLVKVLQAAKIQPKAMLNLDMVGRMESNRLTIFGSDSAGEWRKMLEPECNRLGLECGGGGDGYGPSDHMPFYIAKVPVLHFFTGPHADHHRSSDTFEKLNYTGAAQTAQLVASVARMTAARTVSLHYKRATRAPVMGYLRTTDGHSRRAYLGTIPDYSTLSSPHGPAEGGAEGGGVPLSDTRPGSPSEQAGVKAGDILIGILSAEKSHRIGNLQDFTQMLGELSPGQRITIQVVRGGKKMEFPATVGQPE